MEENILERIERKLDELIEWKNGQDRKYEDLKDRVIDLERASTVPDAE